jgi:1-acyl-sn-glycerol-3-phosphate acyltransferase
MRLIRLTALLLVWPLLFVAVLLTHLVLSLCKTPRRWRWISRLINWNFAALVRAILNIKITMEEDRDRLESGGFFIVSNHLGYVDGIVLGSLFPVIYVSKKEVRGWPLIGQWTALCGTIFIDRQRKDKIPLLVEEIARKLSQKANVLVFPEGTSTNGDRLLPFQSAPFAAPLRARAAILPVTLTYQSINHQPLTNDNRDCVYWYGDMEFSGHFWNLLAVRSIEVTVRIHPAIDTSDYRNDSSGRKALSQASYDSIAGKGEMTEKRQAFS